MSIDFHSAANRDTYTGRVVDPGWFAAVRDLVDPAGADVVDVGCGGGTYSTAWLDLGARSVRGIDFSEQMLTAARSQPRARAATFSRSEATSTGLPSASADIVFARALLHHLPDHGAAVREAARLLRPGGTYVVQDRTVDDVVQPGGPRHPRGYLFEAFPRLLDIELARRPDSSELVHHLKAAGLTSVRIASLWEVRATHSTRDAYLHDVANRTGRSILHDLDNDEFTHLTHHLAARLPDQPVTETDRWTLWAASTPTHR